MIQKTTLAVLLFALFASVFAAGAFSVSEAAPESVALPADAHAQVTLSGAEQRFTFSPAANSVYSVYFFPDGEGAAVDARLYRGGALLATGGGSLRLFEASLSAGETYELVLGGTGSGRLEVMRATLGRCFEKPIELSGDGLAYEKLLVRPGDAHWYAFTAGTGGPATIHAEPEGAQAQGLVLSGLLMDAEGRVLTEVGGDAGGFVIDCELAAGARYYVRVSALNASTGPYRLSVEQDTARAARPESVTLSDGEIDMEIGEARTLTAAVSPQDAHPTVTFVSSNRRRGNRFAIGRGLRRGRGRSRDHRARLGRGERLLRGARGGRPPFRHRLFAERPDAARGRTGGHGRWNSTRRALPTGAWLTAWRARA